MASFHRPAHLSVRSITAKTVLFNKRLCLLNVFILKACFWTIRPTGIYLRQSTHMFWCKQKPDYVSFKLFGHTTNIRIVAIFVVTDSTSYAVFIYVYVLRPYQIASTVRQLYLKPIAKYNFRAAATLFYSLQKYFRNKPRVSSVYYPTSAESKLFYSRATPTWSIRRSATRYNIMLRYSKYSLYAFLQAALATRWSPLPYTISGPQRSARQCHSRSVSSQFWQGFVVAIRKPKRTMLECSLIALRTQHS
jgi:hypothetical protein